MLNYLQNIFSCLPKLPERSSLFKSILVASFNLSANSWQVRFLIHGIPDNHRSMNYYHSHAGQEPQHHEQAFWLTLREHQHLPLASLQYYFQQQHINLAAHIPLFFLQNLIKANHTVTRINCLLKYILWKWLPAAAAC